MMYVYVLFCLSYWTTCKDHTTTEPALKRFKWLVGSWERTNGRADRTSFEVWTWASDQRLVGKGYTLSGSDTVFLETLQLIAKDDAVYYVAGVEHNAAPVYFRMVEWSEDGFVCENPDHDFPKRIAYQRDGHELKATISGNGKSVLFHFRRASD